MYKTPSNFYIGMRGGAPDLCSPLKILFADWRLIPLGPGLDLASLMSALSPSTII
jgi:hypothetical protein